MSINVCIITRPDLEPAVHGAAVKIMETAKALSRLGAEVEIVTNDRLWYYHVSEGEVERLRYPQALLSLTNLPPWLKQRLAGLPVPGYWETLRWLLTRAGYPRDEQFLYQAAVDPDFWLRVLYVGRHHRARVYQAEFPGYAVPAWLAARLLGGRCVLVEHNVEYLRLRDTTELPAGTIEKLKRIEAGLARLVDLVVAVSDPDRRRLIALGVPPARIRVIPHGVNLNAYEHLSGRGIRARYGIEEGAFLLVFHGTLHYWPNTVAVKHIAEDLLPRLEARGVPVRAMVCGINPPRYYAHPRLVFTGVVQDLPEHLAAADVAVVPLDDGGGTRLKILEYFAAGLPVVSTPKGAEGIPVTAGEEIELANDMDDFADAVAGLWRAPDRAARLGEAGRRFVAAYGWNDVGRSYLEAYGVAPQGAPPSSAGPRRVTARPARAARPEGDPLTMAAEFLPDRARKRYRPTMILNLVEACNLSCVFCDQGRGHRRMPFEQARRIIDQAAELGTRTVVFTGGEPLLHPHLWRLVSHAGDRGLGTNVTTNGLLIPRQIGALTESRVDSISVSLDGLEATHDALRGRPGAFRRAVQAIEVLRDHGVETHVHFVVTNRNVGELLAVHALAAEMGAGFDFWPVNDAEPLFLRDEAARRAYRDAVETLAARDPRHAERRGYYLRGLDYHAGRLRAVRCLGLVDQFGVTVDGTLIPCCVWGHQELEVGDLRRERLIDLWVGERARSFRRRLIQSGCTVGCYNHSLHAFEQVTGLSAVLQVGGGR